MLGLAFEGITSLSTKPISMIVGLGFLVSALSFVGIIWAIIIVGLVMKVVIFGLIEN